MCENLKQDRIRCEACRTINLAKHVKHPKPDMQIYEKCTPEKICVPVQEVPLNPTCIKVCDKEEFKLRKSGKAKKIAMPKMPLPYAHGKLMYAVKAGILVGAVYFTYTQGVWGDQQDVSECLRRWSEYIRSINTRRPPSFDLCGNVIYLQGKEITCLLRLHVFLVYIVTSSHSISIVLILAMGLLSIIHQKKESTESILAPIYLMYKEVVTTCFSGVVKVPLLFKCAYVAYLDAMKKKEEQANIERKIRKRG